MKKFRDWWEKHRASVSPHTCQSARGENLACLADAEVWRAALEMVFDWLDYSAEHEEIKDKIQEELDS